MDNVSFTSTAFDLPKSQPPKVSCLKKMCQCLKAVKVVLKCCCCCIDHEKVLLDEKMKEAMLFSLQHPDIDFMNMSNSSS